jgi:membrane associated rhomboid family serine protease
MTEPATEIPETILQNCAAVAPRPWFPAVYARDNGVARDLLDSKLDWLRMGGLVRIADWVQGQGQGYTLTPEGKQVLESPRELDRLRKGQMPVPASAKAEELRHLEPRGSAWERGEMAREALNYRSDLLVTRLLIFLNTAVFVVGLILALQRQLPIGHYLYGFSNDPRQAQIMELCGALTGEAIVKNEWWRLLTCCFVHFGLIHLGLNMWSLYILGRFQEGMWGRARYLIVYLISGVCGSSAMIINNPVVRGAGASGAIWGLMASEVVWVFLNRQHIGYGATIWLRRLMFVFVLNAGFSFLPMISASAHFAGGAAGFIAAVLLDGERFARGLRRWLAVASLAALPVVSIGAVLYAQRVDPRWEELRKIIDHNDWVLRWRPPIEELWHGAADIERGQVEPLRDQETNRFKPGTIDKLVAATNDIRSKLEEGIRRLQDVGPIREQDAERERLSYLQQFETRLRQVKGRLLVEKLQEAEDELTRMKAKRALRKLTWTEKEEEEFKQHQENVKELGEKLIQLQRN